MGLHWRLARRPKATLNLHRLEDTCLAARLERAGAALSRAQEPPLEGSPPQGSLRRTVYYTLCAVALGQLRS